MSAAFTAAGIGALDERIIDPQEVVCIDFAPH